MSSCGTLNNTNQCGTSSWRSVCVLSFRFPRLDLWSFNSDCMTNQESFASCEIVSWTWFLFVFIYQCFRPKSPSPFTILYCTMMIYLFCVIFIGDSGEEKKLKLFNNIYFVSTTHFGNSMSCFVSNHSWFKEESFYSFSIMLIDCTSWLYYLFVLFYCAFCLSYLIVLFDCIIWLYLIVLFDCILSWRMAVSQLDSIPLGQWLP